MANYSKGKETQKAILEASSRLFYKCGYNNTTTRQIASDAGINLGLIKYHFDSKADIACHIYIKIRNQHLYYLSQFDYSQFEIYLLASAAELKLCFTNERFLLFYQEIYQENRLIETLRSNIGSSIKINSAEDDIDRDLSVACLTSIKPALINQYITAGDNHFDDEAYIAFYLKQQLYYYNTPNSERMAKYIMNELKKYRFDVTENFVPIIEQIE